MATITDVRARPEALSAQRASGAARVSHDGKTVEYRVAEYDRVIDLLDGELAVDEGPQIERQLRATTATGLPDDGLFARPASSYRRCGGPRPSLRS